VPVYVLSDVPGSTTRIDRSVKKLNQVFYHGQSNSVWGGLGGGHTAVTITSVVDQYRGFMFNSGFMGTQGNPVNAATDLLDFVPGIEVWKKKGEKGTVGGSSFLRKVLWDQDSIGLKNEVWCVRATGNSGQALTELIEGTVPCNNILVTTSAGRIIANDFYNIEYAVPYIRFAQGESDAGTNTVKANYVNNLETWIKYINRSIKKITRQPEETYVGIDILVAPDGAPRNITPITIGQVELLDYDIPVVPNCSPYWFSASVGFNTGQTVHWNANGKDHLVEFAARAARIAKSVPFGARLGNLIKRFVYNPNLTGSPWELKEVPFETSPRAKLSSFTKSANKIKFTVPYAEGGLYKFEGYRGPAINDGFYWSGPEVYSKVSIATGEVSIGVTVEFTSTVSTADGLLTYAVEPQNNLTDNAPDCFGSLFDNCLEPSFSKPGRTLRQGMLPFSVTIS